MPRSKRDGNGNVQGENYRSLATKWTTEVRDGDGLRWSWDNVDFHTLFTLIFMVTKRKGAVMFGVDRQGVGGTLSVWLGGEKVLNKWYNPRPEGYEAALANIEEFMADLEEFPEPL